jgi:hypothetical protein
MRPQTHRRSSKAGTFFIGFLVGILVSAAIVLVLAGYFIKHPKSIIDKAADVAVERVVEKTVQSVPKDYIGRQQEEIANTARRFADAFSQNRITPAQMNMLAKKMLAVIADQKITQNEIDEILRLMNRYAS